MSKLLLSSCNPETDTNDKKYTTAMQAVEVHMFMDLPLAGVETRHTLGCDMLATPATLKLFPLNVDLDDL